MLCYQNRDRTRIVVNVLFLVSKILHAFDILLCFLWVQICLIFCLSMCVGSTGVKTYWRRWITWRYRRIKSDWSLVIFQIQNSEVPNQTFRHQHFHTVANVPHRVIGDPASIILYIPYYQCCIMNTEKPFS